MARKKVSVFLLLIIFGLYASYSDAYNLYLEDLSFTDKISAEYHMVYHGNSDSKGVLDVEIKNHSSVIDVDDVLITPYITSFLFNLPENAYVKTMDVFDLTSGSQTKISGWTLPYVGMKENIPSPDNHGFWDAGASIGKLFTSGSPEDGIAPGATYLFKFFLEGSLLADLSVEAILAEGPSFGGSGGGAGSGSGSGSGGGAGSGTGGGAGSGTGGGGTGKGGRGAGGGGGDVLPTSDAEGDEAEGGPPSLDWGDGPYFLANLKGAPEGAFDFGLLVPEEVVFPQITESFQAVATPEPSTLALLGLGGLGAVLALRKRRSASS